MPWTNPSDEEAQDVDVVSAFILNGEVAQSTSDEWHDAVEFNNSTNNADDEWPVQSQRQTKAISPPNALQQQASSIQRLSPPRSSPRASPVKERRMQQVKQSEAETSSLDGFKNSFANSADIEVNSSERKGGVGGGDVNSSTDNGLETLSANLGTISIQPQDAHSIFKKSNTSNNSNSKNNSNSLGVNNTMSGDDFSDVFQGDLVHVTKSVMDRLSVLNRTNSAGFNATIGGDPGVSGVSNDGRGVDVDSFDQAVDGEAFDGDFKEFADDYQIVENAGESGIKDTEVSQVGLNDVEDILQDSAAMDDANVYVSGDNEKGEPAVADSASEDRRVISGDAAPGSPSDKPEVSQTHIEHQMLNNDTNTNTISNNPVEQPVEGERSVGISPRPVSSPTMDPILQRRQKMASRIASGKVPIPKALLYAATKGAKDAVTSTESSALPTSPPPPPPPLPILSSEMADEASNGDTCKSGSDDDILVEIEESKRPDGAKETIPLATSPSKRERMASRIASGKVPMPKALLKGSTTNSSSESNANNAHATITALTTERSVELYPSPNRASVESRKLPGSPETPRLLTAVLPTSPRLIISSSGKVEMSLDDEAFGDEENIILLPALQTPIVSSLIDKNDARRQRRQLRKGSARCGQTLESDVISGENDIVEGATEGGTNDGSPIVDQQPLEFGGLLDNNDVTHDDKNCTDATDVGVSDKENLFPSPSLEETLAFSLEKQQLPPLDCPTTPLDSELAWDAAGALGLDAIQKESKSRSNNKADDDKPLLHLGVISSDGNDRDAKELEAIALENLLSQKERMDMYTSGNGFGVGEDSSVDSKSDNMEVRSEQQQEEEFLYNRMIEGAENDAAECDDGKGALDSSDMGFVDFGKGSYEEISTSDSAAMHSTENRALRWKHNTDAMSDAESSVTGGSTVFGLQLVDSKADSTQSSPALFAGVDPDATPKIGTTKNVDGAKKVFKIAPPPPEKLRQWEESKGAGKRHLAGSVEVDFVGDNVDKQVTPVAASPRANQHKPPSYKISVPKSPKKKPHSITDELNLVSHERMAEKIAMASSKAARKFEEQYSHVEHDNQQFSLSNQGNTDKDSSSIMTTSPNRFFCAGDSGIGDNLLLKPFIVAKSSKSTDEPQQLPSKGSPLSGMLPLVGGAFSPWKIPDRADEYSNASSSRVAYDDEMYANATAAALRAIRGNKEGIVASLGSKADESNQISEIADETNLDESFEVSVSSFDAGVETDGESLLSGVLTWLFKEVLPTNAFSAFDINTSTSVQAARVLAIVNDDECLNAICQYVSAIVTKRHEAKLKDIDEQTDLAKEIQPAASSGDISVSSDESSNVTSLYESSVGASSVSDKKSSFSQKAKARILKEKKRGIDPFIIPIGGDVRPPGEVTAANFVSWMQQISNTAGVTSPFGKDNPFLHTVVELTTKKYSHQKQERKSMSMQDLVFSSEDTIISIFLFLQEACGYDTSRGLASIDESADDEEGNDERRLPRIKAVIPSVSLSDENTRINVLMSASVGSNTVRRGNNKRQNPNRPINPKHTLNKEALRKHANLNFIFPKQSPSPFETSVWQEPSIVLSILSFLGNPVSVSMMKRLNIFCNRVVSENEHVLMRDAVRLGGLNMYVRPAFWLWVTLDRCKREDPIPLIQSRGGFQPSTSSPPIKGQCRDFFNLRDQGATGKWSHIIERDVVRAFGNMPPHKTGARYRQDSIVRALVSFGKEEIARNSRSYQALDKLPEESETQHFKLSSRLDHCTDDGASYGSSGSLAPTDTVSDWGGISPVGSYASEEPSAVNSEDVKSMRVVSFEGGGVLEASTKSLKLNSSINASKSGDVSDPVLSGHALTAEMKVDLQNKLRSILHALAAQHEGLGYCQGMDYVVAHLLRVLQDTILLRVIQGSIPGVNNAPNVETNNALEDWRTLSTDQLKQRMNEMNSQSFVVEEVVFRVMDTFFTTYNLQHMYWPELRCLKTCCKVFESLIKQKLPVLADHFEHHDLNVGLFALGWFQTLFLYLPSMPSATVCHLWDIWLVERSFKIFFRVGTAILFLSQPTLLNHDLEGMMTYLNTFPDATLLRRDILIPCALNIKITNRMLMEIEMDVTNFGKESHDHDGGVDHRYL